MSSPEAWGFGRRHKLAAPECSPVHLQPTQSNRSHPVDVEIGTVTDNVPGSLDRAADVAEILGHEIYQLLQAAFFGGVPRRYVQIICSALEVPRIQPGQCTVSIVVVPCSA